MSADQPHAESHHPKKTLHSKRSFGKYPVVDSPAYDASEEDNDPLTDDGASALSVPAISRPVNSRSPLPRSSRLKHAAIPHHLSELSDDGVDSPTYDGDVESSTTVAAPASSTLSNASASASASTMTSPASVARELPPEGTVLTALVPAPPGASDEGQVRAIPVTVQHGHHVTEPPPVEAAQEAFNPASLTPEDIKAFVQDAIKGDGLRQYRVNPPPTGRPIRVYADGVYDLFHFGHALQLRQAKLSFDDVHLLVGVNSDEQVKTNKFKCIMNHAERCEAVRHCRWVDQVVPDAPWVITQEFVDKYQIDYVAHDDDPYVSAGHDDVYQFVKDQGKFFPTRRTPGVSTSELLERIVRGYRLRDFDKKLAKMGRAELMAEGSDFDDQSSKAPSPQ
ncbi:unnamed protein product [Peniophora sp. CBMAI 1063]|nr:unnamed protein product [Peniophora sp. CBMAI 1063]